MSVFPIPGTRYAEPQTQITFRGVPASQLGQISVVGSRSGPHSGSVLADSDGRGGSFLPTKPFTPGETVTVKTSLNVAGGKNGTFAFEISHPAGLIPYAPLTLAPAVRGGIRHYRSGPGLQPAAVDVTVNKAPAFEGDIFVDPQNGPKQDGPMILDPRGNLIWFLPYPVGKNVVVNDFQVQRLHGQPVLTWWQGNPSAGHGRGVGMIYDNRYQLVAKVTAGNGLDMGRHEFLVTNQGDAFFTASWPVRVSFTKRAVVDSVIQEVDIKTGLVLFEWDALDHVPISHSYVSARNGRRLYDPYHANSISLDGDGNLIVSMRNTSAIYKIDRRSGRIIWTLGGKASSFKLGRGVRTFYQHDGVIHPGEQLTVFDDGGGPPRTESYSRGVRIALHTRRRTASLIAQYGHAPPIAADFEGGLQLLSGGDVFLGWGQQPYFSEDNGHGHEIFDAHFAEPTTSYRAYRFPWNGQPDPSRIGAALATGAKGTIHLYASWNGATAVASWRALAGPAPTSLAPVASTRKQHFETEITVHRASSYYQLQAMSSSGSVLGSSKVLSAPKR